MNILTICGDRGIPAFGRKGASTHIREMIRGLRQEGHTVTLAASNLEGDRRADEDFATVALPRPSSKMIGSDGRGILASRAARPILEAAAQAVRPEVVYERLSLYFTAGEWLARRTGLPRILEVNSLLAEEQHTRLHFPKAAGRIERQLILHADGVAAISETMRQRLIAMGVRPDRVRVFSMAVDPRRFAARGLGPTMRKAAELPPKAHVIGFVGSMNHYHKPAFFRRLIATLIEEDREVAGLVVGGTEIKVEKHGSKLSEGVRAGRVRFVGTVPQEDLPGWMEAMDLIVVPGAAPQSTPTKIFEAAAVGRPMILPATEPLRALCHGGGEPLLFAPESFESLLAAVRSWRRDPSAVLAASAWLRERILRDHTWQGEARRLAEWFSELRTHR